MEVRPGQGRAMLGRVGRAVDPSTAKLATGQPASIERPPVADRRPSMRWLGKCWWSR